jgi:hypothetical protein
VEGRPIGSAVIRRCGRRSISLRRVSSIARVSISAVMEFISGLLSFVVRMRCD